MVLLPTYPPRKLALDEDIRIREHHETENVGFVIIKTV